LDKSYARRLALNSAISKNVYWRLPVDDVGHENYIPVGRGVQSSLLCGKWTGISRCKNVEGHEGASLNGEDITGKSVVRNRHMWCKRSLCPICFIRGWSMRRARSIESRLEEGVRRGFGKVEHIVVSPSAVDHSLSESELRKKCRAVLFERGILGGQMTFHGYSKNRERTALVWRPHYHFLGFVEGGYDECRFCYRKSNCLKGCGGFDDRAWQAFQKDGYYVRVFSERRKSYYDDKPNVFGTAFYQLHHATVKIGIGRFHAVTWSGTCGNRKYASPKVVSVDKCPVCTEDMVRSVYVGSRHIVKDVGHPDYKPFWACAEFDENGESNFIDVGG